MNRPKPVNLHFHELKNGLKQLVRFVAGQPDGKQIRCQTGREAVGTFLRLHFGTGEITYRGPGPAGKIDLQGQALSGEPYAGWLPVDWYLGGAEHAVPASAYARFWTKAFYDLGLVKFSEPFLRLRSVGMVLAADGKKMSKSLGNVINPDEVVAEFGADAVRIYEMFMGPWDQAIAWNSRSLIGCRRFIEKFGSWRVGIWPIIGENLTANWRRN